MPINPIKLENLRKANEESHRLIVDSLREALYNLLETKEISEIKVNELCTEAGVSRGVFYKHYYLITDVLKDDIKTVASDVRKTIGPDISINWEIILNAVYQHKRKIPLLLKAGMGMEILDEINRSIDAVPDQYKLRIAAWNGIIFNVVGIWAVSGFKRPIKEMADKLTEITMHLYDAEVAAAFDPQL